MDEPLGPCGDDSPTDTDMLAAVRRLSRTSVLVVGDAMLDRYVHGDVARISPEAPIPVLTIEREIALPGGAGNLVRNITALGAAVAFVSVVGDDQPGSELTGLVGGQPGVEPWLLVQGARATTVKTRFVAAGQHLLRTDREQTSPIHPKLAERLVRIALDAVVATSVTVLSDYGKGVLCRDIPAQLIAGARASGRKVVVDPSGTDYARYAGADVITPSRRALEAASGMPTEAEAEVVAAAQAVRARHGFGAVLVTRGADGMSLIEADRVAHFPAEPTEVFDVSGAGDAVTAAVAAGLAAGLDLSLAARVASLAASVVISQPGMAVARESDLISALTPQGRALRKIVTRETASEQINRWRRKGWRTGFTDGVFDRLDEPQVRRLEQARAECDRLVVGLHADSLLNGRNLAAQPEAARAASVACLAPVDLVCVIGDGSVAETTEATVGQLRPDIFSAVDTPSAALEVLMRSWGGRIVVAG